MISYDMSLYDIILGCSNCASIWCIARKSSRSTHTHARAFIQLPTQGLESRRTFRGVVSTKHVEQARLSTAEIIGNHFSAVDLAKLPMYVRTYVWHLRCDSSYACGVVVTYPSENSSLTRTCSGFSSRGRFCRVEAVVAY